MSFVMIAKTVLNTIMINVPFFYFMSVYIYEYEINNRRILYS